MKKHSQGEAAVHPRPQMQRDSWQTLDGVWQFSKGRKSLCVLPEQVEWETEIRVPFSPETEASGVHDTGFYESVWYRRTWEQEPLRAGERLLLRFEAVDWATTVWVNGNKVRVHEGGYSPFSADITDALIAGTTQEVVVQASDDAADLAKPRGKQDWKLEPHSIWYPRTTGIWQTVWLETVPQVHIHALHWTNNLERWEIGIEALIFEHGCVPAINCAEKPGYSAALRLSIRLTAGQQVLGDDTYIVISGEVHRRIALSDPGIDDYRNELLWSPGSPTLITAEVTLTDAQGGVIDRVQSYTALRSVTTQGDRFLLNGRPLQLRLVLDQGYWIKTGLTPPDDAAIIQDIELVKKLGFNGVRKHQKIESARFLYWADRMGLLVWEEMPSAYRYTTKSIERLTREWLDILQRDRSHPCIIAWVPFNESWGVPDLPESPSQRHYVQSLYHMTKAIDSSRPVIGNDGWESVATDIIGIHDYDDQPSRIGQRYGINDVGARLLKRERPGGRVLTIDGENVACDLPLMLTEFGGIAFGGADEKIWGYSRTETAEQLLERYRALLETVRSLPALTGFCYTQLTDTYQEANGLLYADRTPKASLELIAEATTGLLPDFNPIVDTAWRDGLMQNQHGAE